MERVGARLLALQNPDGGWGTTADRPSNTEATALATLALGRRVAARDRGLEWLLSRQRLDGCWSWTAELDTPSWASSQAILALAYDARQPAQVARGVTWLLAREGRDLEWRARLRDLLRRRKTNELDGTLMGWPWTAGAFSWIEPTSFALLALKAALPGARSRRATERIREAEEMILDRECPGGGWNFGNKRVFGADQAPYPDTTALALLALQGARIGAAKGRALAAIDRMTAAAASGLGLSLAALCRRAWGLDATHLVGRLSHRFAETGFMDETRVLALALLATRDPGPLTLQTNA
jgi:hypothetical protein